MIHYCYMESPIGRLTLRGKEGVLEELHFPKSTKLTPVEPDHIYDENIFREVIRQLDEYFKGGRQHFELDLSTSGTPFQRQVWQELQNIPYGQAVSYSYIAEKIDNPKGCRAVGMANRKNPIPIIIPCHRVIGKDGTLTGFGGGLETKKFLLELEGAI
jgi:methylated-DNA-[protein]-cysteine S-methyltransferase